MKKSEAKNFPPKADQPRSEKRSPIVVVVGHVDHGKTSLLDYIRKTNVTAKEAGGITQSIGAYEIERNGERITFIDTPGHEAFSKMRERGAKVADVAILVVAAEEGVKPQTKEAIQVLLNSKTPFVVAVTKMDKPTADLEKVKKDLAGNNVLLEGFGGSISFQGVSSKTGEGVKELLDLILLTAEMEAPVYDPEAMASGIVLESERDPQRGITVSVILKNGKLKTGDLIVTPTAKGKIRILENFLKKRMPEIIPSSPAVIMGFESLPQLGEEFRAGKLTVADLEAVLKAGPRVMTAAGKKDEQLVRLILKADVSGSLEALHDLLKKIPLLENQRLEVIDQGVGEITDGDVKTAIATGALIIGFRTYPIKAAEALARVHNVTIVINEIIYKLVEEIEKAFAVTAVKGPAGELEVLATFSSQGKKQTVGGRVSQGIIKNRAMLAIHRADLVLGKVKVINLQRKKQEVTVVNAGDECGLEVESDVKIEKGDKLVTNN
ncbi:MAG: GTP-binding protein [bacterium]|nr:GTP-binding protein [bacterium]